MELALWITTSNEKKFDYEIFEMAANKGIDNRPMVLSGLVLEDPTVTQNGNPNSGEPAKAFVHGGGSGVQGLLGESHCLRWHIIVNFFLSFNSGVVSYSAMSN